MTPIPRDKVLDRQTSILDEAVVCAAPGLPYYGSGAPAAPTIYCFVPKLMGL